jgi:hypothetical protein
MHLSHFLQSSADHASYVCGSEPQLECPIQELEERIQLERVPGTQAGIGGWGQRAERQLASFRVAMGKLQPPRRVTDAAVASGGEWRVDRGQ